MAKAKKENASPSSAEIDLAAIEKLAEEVDNINKTAGTEKRTRKRVTTPPAAGAPGDTPPAPAEPLFTPDPEFQFMVTHVTQGAIEGLKQKLNWRDPGLQWKEKVGFVVYRLSQRIRPMGDSWLTDLATLTGYLSLWGVSNVLIEQRENKNPVGDDGKREDVQAKGSLEGAAESYTL